MLIIRIILLLFILSLFVVSANSELQPSIPIGTKQDNQEPPKSDNEQSNKNENRSETLKSSQVQVIPQQQNQESKTNRKQNYQWYDIFTKHPTDWLLAIFNGLLALFTYRLWKTTTDLREVADKQLSEIKASVIVADKAATAAKESADAFQSIERARLFIRVERDPPPKPGEPIESIEEGYNRIRINIINEGKSLAILTKINLQIGVIDDKDIDEKISELKSTTSEYPYGVITISSSSEKPMIVECKITKSDLQKINESTIYYVCLGHLRYKDVFRKVRQIVFCWKDNGTFFFPDPDPKRNNST